MTSDFSPELLAAVARLITAPRVLVATDFDGTIAPLCDNPSDATVDPDAFAAMRILSELPNTEVCVISGRSLHELRSRFSALDRVRLVGSHGSEFDTGISHALSEMESKMLQLARQIMAGYAADFPGSFIEEKPHGLSFHYRLSDATRKPVLVEALGKALDSIAHGFLRRGKDVLEFSIKETNKGLALEKMRQHTNSPLALFIGDDVTDEDAFARVGEFGISVKVGNEPTIARYRVDTPKDAIALLVYVAEARSRWFETSPATEIQQHLLLSDLRTTALVDDRGSITWLCFPRVDSAPVFGALVGGPAAGSFSLHPLTANLPASRYTTGTMIAETEWGALTVTDFLDTSAGRHAQRAGRSDLFRLVSGSGMMEVRFAPRLDFGRIPTRIVPLEYGLKVEGGTLPLVLHSPGWRWEIVSDGIHSTAISKRMLQNETTLLQLRLGTATAPDEANEAVAAYAGTETFWRTWRSTLKLPPLHRESVERSALLLRALIYGPTGAIVAAPTTSLPETIGGVRNWDYRFSWLRDGAFASAALARLGSLEPGLRFLDWLLEVVDDLGPDEFLAPLYTVLGKSLAGEAEVSEAVGYRASRPVRVGNLAAQQLQLDTLAPIIELLYVLQSRGAGLTFDHVRLIDHIVELVATRWEDPDSGIWEIRGPQRHYVHSKLMCWYTVARSNEIVERLGFARRGWSALADTIRTDIETRGFSERVNSYICAYDLEEPDAALLWIILSHFHPPEHPRSIGTLQYITATLLRNSGVYRYTLDDGIVGEEGSFHICLAWLIQALALQGSVDEANQLFERLIDFSAPLGLLSEQWDPIVGRALGNYPQAYSHTGLIDAALLLSGPQPRFR